MSAPFDWQSYADALESGCRESGIYLSDAELRVLSGLSITISPGLQQLIDESQAQVDRDLAMNIGTLVEAEAAKSEAEAARDRARELNAALEERNAEMQALNAELQKRNAKTEAQLVHEQEARTRQEKTYFQRSFATYLMIMIGALIALMYVGSIFGAADKLLDASSNFALLLLQTLGVIAGFLFNRKQDDEDGKKRR